MAHGHGRNRFGGNPDHDTLGSGKDTAIILRLALLMVTISRHHAAALAAVCTLLSAVLVAHNFTLFI